MSACYGLCVSETTSLRLTTKDSPHPGRWLALAAIALGTSLVIMDATIANVALPVVIADLNLTATDAEWMNAVYSLVFASLMLTSGRLGDLYGRKTMFISGLALFAASSLAVGSAPSAAVLIGARLVQGLGAAMVLPATLSTINALFFGRERNIAFAVYGSTIGGMAAVGPLLGGWLATDVSWRWAFWLNIPFGLIALALAVWCLPETRDPHLRRGIDVPGTILATLGLAGIVFGLIEATTFGWWTQSDGSASPVPFAIGAGVVLLAAFAFVERRREARDKIVLAHLGLFGIKTFRYGSIAALIVSLGEFGLLFTLPLVLQGAMGYDALGTGWLILALAVGTFFASGIVPQVTKAIGQRSVVRIGLGLEAVAVGGLAVLIPAGTWTMAALLFLYGVGVGFATAQLTSVILVDVPRKLSGEASGLQTTVRQLGSALGVALLGGLLISSLTSGTASRLDEAGVPEPHKTKIVTAVHDSVGAAIPGLAKAPQGAKAAELASDAMLDAARSTTGIAAGVLVLGLLATFALPHVRDEDEPQPTEEQRLDVANL